MKLAHNVRYGSLDMLPNFQPGFAQVVIGKAYRSVQCAGAFRIGVHGNQGGAQRTEAAQTLGQQGLANPFALVIGVGADRLERGGAGVGVVPDRAETGKFTIGRHRHQVQVTAVKRGALNVAIPFPTLILAIRFSWMESLPGDPTAGRQFIVMAQVANGIAIRQGNIDGRLPAFPAALEFWLGLADVTTSKEDILAQFIARRTPNHQFLGAIRLGNGIVGFSGGQHLHFEGSGTVVGVALQEGFAGVVRVQDCSDLAALIFPNENSGAQVKMENIGIDMPYPVIPAIKRPTVLAPPIQPEYLLQELANALLVCFTPIFFPNHQPVSLSG